MIPPRVPDSWLLAAADPEGAELEGAIGALVEELEGASRAAAAIAGEPPLGVRAVTLAGGPTHTLCAFAGPRFLCLDPDSAVVRSRHVVLRHAAVGLLWEQLEVLVDGDRLDALAASGGRVLAAAADHPEVTETVQAVVEADLRLVGWRSSPLRAVASMTQVDVASTLQERTHRAFERFVTASEPLVERQHELGLDLIGALRGFEEAAAAAGIGERLADRLALILPGCDEGAAEMADAHVTPLL